MIPPTLMERRDISASAKMVWLGLRQFMATDGIARPLLADLQRATGIADRTLRRGLAELVEAGILRPSRLNGVTGFLFVGVDSYPVEKINSFRSADRHNSEKPEPLQPLDCQPLRECEPMTNGAKPYTGQVIEAADLFQSSGRPPRARASTTSVIEEPISPPLEKKKGGAGGKRRKVPVALAPDWCPSPETLAHCAKRRPDVDLSRELEAMRFYFRLGAKAGTLRASWEQTYVNWIDRASPASAPPSRASAAAAGRGPVESEGAMRLRQIIGETG